MTADEQVEALRAAHRDSYPMGNIHHGTPENPGWGTFCVECKQSWPCEVVRLLDAIPTIVAAERAAALREAADDPTLRLSGHSGVSITRLRERADRETS